MIAALALAVLFLLLQAKPASAGTLTLRDGTVIHTRSTQIAGGTVYYTEYEKSAESEKKNGKNGKENQKSQPIKQVLLANVQKIAEQDPPKNESPKHAPKPAKTTATKLRQDAPRIRNAETPAPSTPSRPITVQQTTASQTEHPPHLVTAANTATVTPQPPQPAIPPPASGPGTQVAQHDAFEQDSLPSKLRQFLMDP